MDKKSEQVRIKKALNQALVLIGSFLLLIAFGSCGGGPPDWREVGLENPAASPSPPSIKTTNELVVYLDESGSMAGYVSRDGLTVFGKALRELRFATGTFTGSARTVILIL